MTVLVLLGFLGLSALAEDPLVAARSAQRSGDPAAERTACRAVLDAASSPAGVRACTQRIAWLDARRDADGTWQGLRLLERARRGEPVRSLLEGRVSEDDTAPRVREEAHLWMARTDLRDGALPAALARTTALWADIQTQPAAPSYRQVAALHARVLARSGRLAEAESVEALLGDLRSARPREGVVQERRVRTRGRLVQASWALLGAGLVASLPSVWRARRERGRFEGLLALWTVGGGLGVLAWLRDPSTAGATASLLAVLSLQAVISAYALRGTRPGLPRLALRLLLGGAAAGSSVLVLDHHGFLAPLLG